MACVSGGVAFEQVNDGGVAFDIDRFVVKADVIIQNSLLVGFMDE